LRHASVSHVINLKSIHSWCCTHICAFCLREKSVLRGSSGSDNDGLTLVEMKFGAVSYFIHLQCRYSLETTTIINSTHNMNSSKYMQMLDLYEYKRPDDVECDLCGLRGGILRHFSLDEHSSSLPRPSPAGWLAHISCCFHLANSHLLQPFHEVSTDSCKDAIEPTASSSDVMEGRKQTVGEYFLSPLGQSQSIARALEVEKITTTGNRMETIGNNEKACSHSVVEEVGVEDIQFVLNEIIATIESKASEQSDSEILVNGKQTDVKEVFLEEDNNPEEPEEDINNIIKTLLSSMLDDLSRAAHTTDTCSGIPTLSEPQQCNTILTEPPLEDITNESPLQPLSRFDLGMGQWRCALCGLTAGLTLRCCALSCGVRCHAICAGLCNLAVLNGSIEDDRTWMLGVIYSAHSTIEKIDRNAEEAFGMLCPAHNKCKVDGIVSSKIH